MKSVTYHPFGELYSQEGLEDHLFTGKEKDASGLYYYGARYYDPDLGRFVTRDTWTFLPNDARSFEVSWLLDPQQMNRYAYCLNNPLKYIDPTGHGLLADIAVALATAALLISLVVVIVAFSPAALFFFALAAVTYVVTIAEYGLVEMNVWKDGDGAVVAREWKMGNGTIVGGYYQSGDHWMVWSTAQQCYVPVPLDQWQPPYNPENEPVTIEEFPPEPTSHQSPPTFPTSHPPSGPPDISTPSGAHMC